MSEFQDEKRDDEDVEGHSKRPLNDDGADVEIEVEGHSKRPFNDDGDDDAEVEGHMKRGA